MLKYEIRLASERLHPVLSSSAHSSGSLILALSGSWNLVVGWVSEVSNDFDF